MEYQNWISIWLDRHCCKVTLQNIIYHIYGHGKRAWRELYNTLFIFSIQHYTTIALALWGKLGSLSAFVTKLDNSGEWTSQCGPAVVQTAWFNTAVKCNLIFGYFTVNCTPRKLTPPQPLTKITNSCASHSSHRFPKWTVSSRTSPISPQAQALPSHPAMWKFVLLPSALPPKHQGLADRHGHVSENCQETGQLLQCHHLQQQTYRCIWAGSTEGKRCTIRMPFVFTGIITIGAPICYTQKMTGLKIDLLHNESKVRHQN